jgi:hypothetical protein
LYPSLDPLPLPLFEICWPFPLPELLFDLALISSGRFNEEPFPLPFFELLLFFFFFFFFVAFETVFVFEL